MQDSARQDTAPRETAEGVVGRLAVAKKAIETDDVLLAFDADGTLWSGDVGNDLFEALIAARGVRDEAHAALSAEATRFGIAERGSPTEIAQALYEAHLAGTYPEDRAFAMMAWVFAGFSIEEVKRFSENVVRTTRLEERLHRFLKPVFDWAKIEHVPIWVVSASAKWMVEIGVAHLGIPNNRVIGMTPRLDDGIIQPTLDGLPIYGPNKPIVLRAVCPTGVLLGAFGDSSYDAPLMAQSKVPVAVRPKPKLLACLKDVPNMVVVGND